MNKILSRSKNHIINSKSKYMFLITVTLVGIISGILFILFISNKDKSLVKESITLVVDTISDHKINYFNTFINSISKNLLGLVSIYILGISIIGIPLILLFLFMKGFSLGFSISSFVSVYHFKGMLLSFLYLIPSDVLTLTVYVLLGFQAINFSIRLFRYLFLKENIILNRYFVRLNKAFLVSLVLILIISFSETFLVPFIIDLCV